MGSKVTCMFIVFLIMLLTSPTFAAWGNLVGKPSDEAVEQIKQSDPSLTVQTVKHDAMVTMDFRENRVRVFVNDDGTVARPPKRG